MGKGHKERRRQQRARELEERASDERLLKQEVQEENDKREEEWQQRKQQNEQQAKLEKSNESLSDTTDSGHASGSITTSRDSLQSSKSDQPDEVNNNKRRRSLIKGLYNIGNTCFFNVIIQSLAHTSLLIDTMHQTMYHLIKENEKKHSTTITAQLMNVFDQFLSADTKKPNIDPKPLFNCLIQKVPSYKGYDQHDSHELFMNLMLILRAEEIQLRKLESQKSIDTNNTDNRSEMFCLIGCNEPYTTYDSIFGGHLLDAITCKKCGKSLMKIEPFLGLLLPLTDRISPSENYRNRRKRDEYTTNKSKKEPKTLSKKQVKALKKQEKRNTRRSARIASSKIKNRQSATKTPSQDGLNQEDLPSVESIEDVVSSDMESEIKEPVETKNDDSIKDEIEQQQSITENKDDNDEEEPSLSSSDEDEEAPKGPLKTVESICTLADMISKLTLIHEASSQPLPFVDESTAQQFLKCRTIANETDDIKTLEQCFDRYFKPETLSGENLFDCYYCRSLDQTQKKVLTEATRQTVFMQLPPILPIFLKRFQVHNFHSAKINKYIEFPLQLDLTDRCSTQLISSSSFIYSLYAVVEHTGTLRSGHYVVYIKQSFADDNISKDLFSKPIDILLEHLFNKTTDEACPSNAHQNEITDPSCPPPSWYHISDNAIHKVPETKVLEADAYVLFYQRSSIVVHLPESIVTIIKRSQMGQKLTRQSKEYTHRYPYENDPYISGMIERPPPGMMRMMAPTISFEDSYFSQAMYPQRFVRAGWKQRFY